MLVWLNGQFVSPDQAVLSVFDAGLQHGVGLFETMAARGGSVFRAQAHVRRLADSARELLLTDRLHVEPLVEAVAQVAARSDLDNARIRLTLTGGNLNLLQSQGADKVDPTILIVAQPATVYPDVYFERGVTVLITDGRQSPFDPMAGHKTLNYWPRIRALQQAASHRAGEALWLTVSNHLASGSVSNVFLVRDETLQTPFARGEEEPGALPSPVLPGITRAAIIAAADQMGLETKKRMLDIEDLLGADEVFLTNSSWGVLSVIGVAQKKIGEGTPGEITKRLRAAWLELVEKETAGGE